MNLRSKQWQIFLGTIVVLALAGAWFTSSDAGVYASHASDSSPSHSSPPQGSPSWITQSSALAGKVIHYSEVETAYVEGSPDIKNGKSVLGNIWEQIDPNGQVTVFHGVYTSIDGNIFYQEIFENASTNITVFGKNDPAIQRANLGSSSTNRCILQSQTSSSDLSSSLQLPFLNETAIKDDGFSMSIGKPTQVLPTTPPLVQIPSLAIYSSDSPVQIWTKTESIGTEGTTRMHMVEVDAQKRIVATASELIDHPSGKVVSSTRISFGSVYVYDSAVVLTSVSLTPQQILAGGCTR